MRFRILTVLILILVCSVIADFATAEDLEPDVPWLDRRVAVLTPQIIMNENQTVFTVYSAPYENAWQDERDQLAFDTNSRILLLGQAHNGQWQWIEYKDAEGISHVGWIKMQVQAGTVNEFSPVLSARCLSADLTMLDAPGSGRTVHQLSAGDHVSVLKLCYDTESASSWAYAETIVNGRPLWGFIPNHVLEEIAAWHIDGETLYVRDGITILGDLWIGYDPEISDEDDTVSGYADFGIGDCACNDLNSVYYGFDYVKRIVLPESIRVIGTMAISGLDLTELRLPGSVQYAGNVESLYGLNIGRLILAKDYVCGLPSLDLSIVKAYEVEPGNPVYSAQDGVLFSADRKKLIRYPDGADAEHYDVPRGVETIARSAFGSNNKNVPLKTISLPIGLKEIDEYAFAALGRLISIAIPPTVTKLASNAFSYCVSLERVSLPEGMDVSLSRWALPGDFTHYNGDNGSASSARDLNRDDLNSVDKNANLVSLDRSPVPVYQDAYTSIPLKMLPFGTRIYAKRVENGRCEFYTDNYTSIVWVEIANLQFACENFYFRFIDADFEDNRWPVAETGEPAYRQMFGHAWLDDDTDTVSFYRFTVDGDDFQEWSLDLPLRDATLYRSGPDDGRLLGYLDAGEMTEPVAILDAPSGSLVGYQFPHTQAQVLETRDGWLLVHTAQYEGWIEKSLFIPVYPEK